MTGREKGGIRNIFTCACIGLPMALEEYGAYQYQDERFVSVSKRSQLKIGKAV